MGQTYVSFKGVYFHRDPLFRVKLLHRKMMSFGKRCQERVEKKQRASVSDIMKSEYPGDKMPVRNDTRRLTMKYDFDEIIDRSGTHAVKVEGVSPEAPDDSVLAWIADMDFAPPKPVLDALEARLDRKIFGYTIYDNKKLKQAVTGWFKRRHDWIVDPQDIFYSPSIIPALSVLIKVLTEPGDGIIIQSPVYTPFTTQIEGNDRRVFRSPLINDGGFYHMDYEDLERKFADPDVKGMIFCNPHNPVGRVWTSEELETVTAIAKTHDKWIISDEIHMDISRIGIRAIPLMTIAPEYTHRIIACTAPTKTFNLAGLGISNIVIPNKEYQRLWQEVMDKQLHLSMASPLAIEATIAAYEEGDEWLDQLKEYLDENFRVLREFMERELPEAVMTQSEGTYLAWINLGFYCNDAGALEKRLISHGVILNQGLQFGEEGSCYVRMNLGMPRANLQELLVRLKNAMESKGS